MGNMVRDLPEWVLRCKKNGVAIEKRGDSYYASRVTSVWDPEKKGARKKTLEDGHVHYAMALRRYFPMVKHVSHSKYTLVTSGIVNVLNGGVRRNGMVGSSIIF